MPKTRSTRAADEHRQAGDLLSDDASDPDVYDDTTAEPRARGAPAPAAPGAPGASTSVDTERLLTNVMQSFARMQAETNRTLAETLRSLSCNSPWNPAASPSNNLPPVAAAAGCGNFGKCTARFDGSSRDAEVLEAFLDAVSIYKECNNVSDEHALRGLPMLLVGDAAVWWRGARTGAISWTDAVARLRSMYGTPQPAYKILREIFAEEQKDSERAEVFMCKVRSLLAKLPYVVPVRMQIDIIYGLLHRRVRKRLHRDDTGETVDLFIDKVRSVEDTVAESQVLSNSTYSVSGASAPNLEPKSNRSIDRGVTLTTGPSITTGAQLTPNSKENSKRDKRVRCSYCKFYGHIVTDCRNLQNKTSKPNNVSSNISVGNNNNNPIRCYGCGQPGVVRSRCETCLNKNVPTKSSDFNIVDGTATDADVDRALCATSVSKWSHPMVSVVIANREGVAIVDTGATCSIASPMLHDILRSSGVQFRESERTIGLADGSRQLKVVLTATVPVKLESKEVATEFVVFPGENTRTLLGRSFISEAGLVLDLAQESWYFSDNPDVVFPFVQSYVLNNATATRSPEQRSAFETIESLLVSAPTLRQADESKRFVLRTDSSSYALGAALLEGEGVDERPVGYASRLLTAAERKYSTTEREALAVVWAVSKFRKYIDGAEVVVRSDHQPLRWLMSLKSPSGRLARWALSLQEYNLKIEYTPGKSNVIADTSSRPACTKSKKLPVVSMDARDVHEKAQATQKRYADENRRPAPDYKVGDYVLLKTQGSNDANRGQTPKFIPRRDGPYRVREVVSATTFVLERISDGVSLGKYHVSLLTPFVGRIQAPVQEKRRRGRPRKANPTSRA